MAKGIQKRQSKENTGKKRRIRGLVLSAGLLLLAGALTVNAHDDSRIDGNAVIATINGELLTYKEFQLNLSANRAQVSAYFQSKYQAGEGKRFWTESYNGEVPLDKLKQDTLDGLVRIKTCQLLAKQKGVVQDISYKTFLRNLASENDRRAKAQKRNQPVYGPLQYGEQEYYGIVQSNLVGDLKKLLQKEQAVSDRELQDYYKANQDRLYKDQDTVKIRKFTVTRGDAGNSLREVQTAVAGGADLETALAPYKEQLRMEEQVFDSQSAHSDVLAYPGISAMLPSLQEGQVTDVYQESGTFWISKVMAREPGGYQSFEAVRESIRAKLSAEAYDRLIGSLADSAQVVVNDKVYGRIGATDLQ